MHCATQVFILRMIENPNNWVHVGKRSNCSKHVTTVTCSGKQFGMLYLEEFGLEGNRGAIAHRTTPGFAGVRTRPACCRAAWVFGGTMAPWRVRTKTPMERRPQIAWPLGQAQSPRTRQSSARRCCLAPRPKCWCVLLVPGDDAPRRPRGRIAHFPWLDSSTLLHRGREDVVGTAERRSMPARCNRAVCCRATGGFFPFQSKRRLSTAKLSGALESAPKRSITIVCTALPLTPNVLAIA